MSIICIRGAITVNNNIKEEIYNATEKMMNEIINHNDLDSEDIISITFTATKDLDTAYPAVAARKLGIVNAALMCVQELNVIGSLEKVIRVAVLINSEKTQKEAKHVYLEKATALRPDLLK